MWDGYLGRISTVNHRIDLRLLNMCPIQLVPYRARPRTRDFEKSKIDNMLTINVKEPTQTEWASPVVLAPKHHGTILFCIDYRKLNAVPTHNSYPLPRMDDCIDSLEGAQVFSTLEANSG